MANPWPSPLPGPAWQSWRTACDHIETRTLRGLSPEAQAALLRQPVPLAVWEYMSRLARWGDVAKVQAASQVWLAVVKQALAQYRKEAA